MFAIFSCAYIPIYLSIFLSRPRCEELHGAWPSAVGSMTTSNATHVLPRRNCRSRLSFGRLDSSSALRLRRPSYFSPSISVTRNKTTQASPERHVCNLWPAGRSQATPDRVEPCDAADRRAPRDGARRIRAGREARHRRRPRRRAVRDEPNCSCM